MEDVTEQNEGALKNLEQEGKWLILPAYKEEGFNSL